MLAKGASTKIGILSDTHVAGPEALPALETAFRFLLAEGVDAVVHCGDVTDLGYLSQLEVFISAWRRVMPSAMPLVAAFGNRDLSDTAKMPAERRIADRDKLILSNPASAMRDLCGWSVEVGLRAYEVRGVPIVAADWGHEGELEAFLAARPRLRRAAGRRMLVSVQHLHPQGTLYGADAGSWMADDGRSARCLGLFPRACSFSGHSHVPFAKPGGIWRGDFTAVAAGSYYLGPPTATGGREVSVLTVSGEGVMLERRDLVTGFREIVCV